jgi:hypothetical protein
MGEAASLCRVGDRQQSGLGEQAMKKIPREPMRPETEPGADPEIWQPDWKCFCCHDSGIVHHYLAKLVIDGYDSNRDKLPRCHNLCCNAGSHYDGYALTDSVDYRLDSETCQELDSIERENWRDYVEQQRQKLKIDLSTIGKNLRGRDRTSSEEMEARQKHQAVLASMNGQELNGAG